MTHVQGHCAVQIWRKATQDDWPDHGQSQNATASFLSDLFRFHFDRRGV